jgi:hypothetical protein
MTLNWDLRFNASNASSSLVPNCDGGNCFRRRVNAEGVDGAITMSISFVDRGMPCAELANDPETK